MRIEVKFSEEVAIVRLSGRFLAGGDGPFLRQKVRDLLEAGTKKLVIDFAEVPYIDSTGLGFLAATHATTKTAGVRMVLSNLNPYVRKVMDGVQLSQFFVIAQDEAAALARLKETGPGAENAGSRSARASKGKKSPFGANS